MKFYDREIETATLRRIEATSHEFAQMTVITGRRRIGKTTLIKHAYCDTGMVYFFVARKSEASKSVADFLSRQEANNTALRNAFAILGFQPKSKVK